MNEKEEIDEILAEHTKKMKELYSKYPHIDGTLDSGPPKAEENRIRAETLEKMQKVREKYNKWSDVNE